MTILRDLVSRVTFRTDLTPLHQLDATLGGVKQGIAAIAGTALSGWAVKAGGDIDFLHLQLGRRFGGSLDVVKAKIDELAETDPMSNLASIFSEEDLLRASIALSEMGFSGERAAKILEQSSTLITRSGENILGTATALGRGIQTGGLNELLQKWDFFGKEIAEDFQIIEARLGESAGELSARRMRQRRDLVANIIAQNREALEKERAQLETSGAGANMRIGAQMENLWKRIARTINEAMIPALNAIAGLMEKASTFVAELREEIVKAGGAAEAFFNKMNSLFPEHTTAVEAARTAWGGLVDFVNGLFSNPVTATASIGGVLMFLLTRNPKWLLWGIVGSSFAGMILGQWGQVEGVLKKPVPFIGPTIGGALMFLLTRNPLWIGAGAFAGAKAEEFITDIFEKSGLNNPNSPIFRWAYGNPYDPNNPGGQLGLPPPIESREVPGEFTTVYPRPPRLPETEVEFEPTPKKQEIELELEEVFPPPLGLRGDPNKPYPNIPSLPQKSSDAGASINWTGNIVVNAARMPEETARLVRAEIEKMGRVAIGDLIIRSEAVT